MALDAKMVTTTLDLPGYKIISSLGLARGIVVRSRSIIGNTFAAIQAIFGGQISIYKELCDQARQDAYLEMLAEAESRGANALIGVRFESNEVTAGITEVFAYGTAVVVEPE